MCSFLEDCAKSIVEYGFARDILEPMRKLKSVVIPKTIRTKPTYFTKIKKMYVSEGSSEYDSLEKE